MTNKPMLSVELLPCPMCSGKVREPVAKHIGHGDFCFVVSCNCGLSFDGGQDIESAVRTWNRRSTPAAQHQGEPVAWLIQCQHSGLVEQSEPNNKSNHPDDWSDAFPVFREQPAPVAVTITDEQILEAMRLSITAADGVYVYDMSPEYVIAAGRSLLEVASLLDIKQSPVAVVMLEKLIEAIGVEQDRLFQDAERMTVEDCVKVIRQEAARLNGVKP